MTFDAVVQTEDEGVFIELPAGSEFTRARLALNVDPLLSFEALAYRLERLLGP